MLMSPTFKRALGPALVLAALITLVPSRPGDAGGGLPGLPSRWPNRIQVGVADQPGGAKRLANTTNFGFRYQYLAGGVNTGDGWATWNENGHFVTYYIEESKKHDIRPAFVYYMLQQSEPATGTGSEKEVILRNLRDTSTMRTLYRDLRLFFRRASAFPKQMVTVNVEPDLWGYVQQAADGNDAKSIPAKVAATGIDALEGLPNNVSGFARAIIRLRNRHAPNVVLGYHLSVWGTDIDISISDPNDAEIDRLGRKAGNFYKSLDADFDIAFGEFDDRDSGFNQKVLGDGGASWWTPGDFRRNRRFLAKFVDVAHERVVMWQIPLGNTRMRAMNNTWNHYQDNRPQWLLGKRGRDHLRAYARAGVVAFLFGGGAAGTTCACDAAADGVTNPKPINGNDVRSYNADDDGGYFRRRARRYYSQGAIALP